MRRLLAGLCAVIALSGSAPTAMAQNIGAEYAAAFQAFRFAGTDPDLNEQARIIAATLPELEGKWIRADILAGEGPQFNASRIADYCDSIVYALRQTAPHGFVMGRTNREGDVVLNIRHDYLGGRLFQRSADENEVMASLGMDLLPGTMFIATTYTGRVMLYHPSQNILVMQRETWNAEIYARCP